MKLTVVYTCGKCKKELDVNSFRAGRVPELCKECRRQQDLLNLRIRQRRFYTMTKLKEELGV